VNLACLSESVSEVTAEIAQSDLERRIEDGAEMLGLT
jgi:hypothetical protein